MPDKIYALNIPPGIQKDGTPFAARCWIDGLWTRFQRGLPRKMGGYTEIATSPSIVRGTYVTPYPPNFIVFYGTDSQLFAQTINADPTNPFPIGASVDRTPAAFQTALYDWQFDTMFSAPNNNQILVAHAGRNLQSIANTFESPIFYGNLLDNSTLIPNGTVASGGIVVLHPFLFSFGNDGQVNWFEPNNPTQIRGTAIVAGDKIVAGLPARGGTNSPAGLLWTLNSLVRVTFTGEVGIDFNFDSISSESSLLSSRSIIEYDNIYYWLGVDRFLLYNGTVQELPNDKNINWFFDNLNYEQRQKVWATKVTRFGEIWWHFPFGRATECNAAVIYNVRERCWYSTFFDILEIGGRSDGYFDQTYSKPIWASTSPDNLANYPLFVHEVGTDSFTTQFGEQGIPTSITTASISYCATAIDNARTETDANLYISKIEPDFIMSGTMSLAINAKEYAASQLVQLALTTFDSNATFLNFTAMGRQIYIEFFCGGVGCDYQMGQVLIVGKLGDLRP